MELRKTKFYKELDFNLAYAITGFKCGYSEKEELCAFQYLVDIGVVWSLAGTFGQTANELIKQGKIKEGKR